MTAQDRVHHHADDLLDDYLLGNLSASEQAWFEAHLEQCQDCRAEYELLLGAAQALPFAAPDPQVQMSTNLWDRIERSISATSGEPTPMPPPVTSIQTVSRPSRPWALIAALMVVSLISGLLLGQFIPVLGDDEANVQQIAIQFTDPSVTATGELRYLPDEQVFVLEITGMPEPPEGYVYQAWLIDEDAPIPVGVVDASAGEFASSGNREQFQTFALTVEQGPLGNAAPTSDPVLVASLQESGDS